MGYQVGVTPLQMAAAVSSVANGGVYVEPRVIRAIYRDNRRFAVQPKIVRRTISADTAAALTTIMEQVVERGTATFAQLPGYTIAGKTGTANKLQHGRYSSDTYASFIGFLPSRDPAVAIIVVLDSPRGRNGHFGGPVSAPIFKRIAESTLRYLGIGPTINPSTPVLVARRGESGPPTTRTVVEHSPADNWVAEELPGTVPNVRGLSAREAIRKLVRVGLNARVSGDGFVVSQEPEPGTPIESDAVCRLVLERWPSRHSAPAGRPCRGPSCTASCAVEASFAPTMHCAQRRPSAW
jgi:cell division protein FtsI (penicillin-binding protein 3)